ncbi:MAG: type I 3-dehydroquinate dehydratase [Methanobacteriaceae archaeon]|nr:type I 3-dehydroquinate dehydratase [Methanobacteriaceae archaeon]MDP2835684.1 type I 3-dehydroquinate dehydratase [Methanobacteriaceae archaeon]MDP3035165.1 type I 3-dehydroquinate dehydratase [Methanobacteriaceae archaeon]MDP3485893.1 type I 3-dehydroquinate dehydratase [Methanobacteriaceae archaeon]MDP3622901.1 type I 3-dehydroquinate dehydratase [Methanobacteriaceae archaeon]
MVKHKICTPVFEKTVNEAYNSAKICIESGADLLEIRIDALKNPTPKMAINLIKEIDFPIIATNRISTEGGFFSGSEQERTEILMASAKEAEYVDIELNCHENFRSQVIESAHCSIISFHDFEKTPSLRKLLDVVEKEKEIGNIAKFAVTPQNISDTITILNVLSEYPDTVAISMGEMGKYTRIVGPLLGSPFTFASVGAKTAPGQLDLKSTRFMLDKLTEK